MGAKKKAAAPNEGAAVTAAVQTEEKPASVQTEEQTAEEAEIPVYAAYASYEETPWVVRAGKGLNLREGPGPAFPVREVLADGTPVRVVPLPYGAEVPGWALVAAPNGFGWVMRDFLAATGED